MKDPMHFIVVTGMILAAIGLGCIVFYRLTARRDDR